MDWLLLVAAVLVILFGVGHIALTVGGSSTTAQVTACEQVLYTHDDDATRNPSRYKLEYQFSVNGEPYTGSVTRVFAGGTHMRQTVPVHYLPIWPHINAEERGASPVGPVTLGAGMLMLVLGIRRKPWARG